MKSTPNRLLPAPVAVATLLGLIGCVSLPSPTLPSVSRAPCQLSGVGLVSAQLARETEFRLTEVPEKWWMPAFTSWESALRDATDRAHLFQPGSSPKLQLVGTWLAAIPPKFKSSDVGVVTRYAIVDLATREIAFEREIVARAPTAERLSSVDTRMRAAYLYAMRKSIETLLQEVEAWQRREGTCQPPGKDGGLSSHS